MRQNISFFAPTLSPGQSEAQVILFWRQDLEQIATFLGSLAPSRLSAKDAALAFVMHVRETAHEHQLPMALKLRILEVIDLARDAANISKALSLDALEKQISRGNPKAAAELLRGWKQMQQFSTLFR